MKRKVKRNILLMGSILIIMVLGSLNNFISFLGVNDKDEVIIRNLKDENKRLKEELNNTLEINDLKRDEDIILARVITRNIYNFYDEVIIDKGSIDGLDEKMAVISGKGLLGIIRKVEKKRSFVSLISNKNLNISVRVNDSYGNLNNFLITNIKNDSVININDEVYTSGLTDIRGEVYIGKVKEIIEDGNKIEKRLVLETEVNYGKINYVGVLK